MFDVHMFADKSVLDLYNHSNNIYIFKYKYIKLYIFYINITILA